MPPRRLPSERRPADSCVRHRGCWRVAGQRPTAATHSAAPPFLFERCGSDSKVLRTPLLAALRERSFQISDKCAFLYVLMRRNRAEFPIYGAVLAAISVARSRAVTVRRGAPQLWRSGPLLLRSEVIVFCCRNFSLVLFTSFREWDSTDRIAVGNSGRRDRSKAHLWAESFRERFETNARNWIAGSAECWGGHRR